MSNRNFDASVVTGRIRDKNVTQQMYGAMRAGRSTGNPQTVNANASIMTEYNEGVETVVEKGLRAGYTFDLGAIANYVALDEGGGAAPAPAPPAPTVPGAPTITLLTPGNATIVVDFTAPSDGGSALTLYEYVAINQSIIGAPDISGTVIATPLLSQITVPGLTNGQEYTVKLRAQNSVGWGAYSAEAGPAMPIGPPPPPTLLSYNIAGPNQILVNFTQTSNGGSPITNYLYSTNGGGTLNQFSPPVTGSPATISGLLSGNTYNVLFRGINAVGTGGPSNILVVNFP